MITKLSILLAAMFAFIIAISALTCCHFTYTANLTFFSATISTSSIVSISTAYFSNWSFLPFSLARRKVWRNLQWHHQDFVSVLHYALPSDANLFYFMEADIWRLTVRHIAYNPPVLVRQIANNLPDRGPPNSTNHTIPWWYQPPDLTSFVYLNRVSWDPLITKSYHPGGVFYVNWQNR